MLTTKTRTVIGSLSVAFVFAVVPAASQAAVNTAPPSHQIVSTGPTVMHADAAPTGQGPAGRGECNRWAAAINEQLAFASVRHDQGNQAASDAHAAAAESLKDHAMDRGCFVVD